MSWFKNLKIKVKIISCFVVLSIISGIIGYIDVNSMNSIKTGGDTIYHHSLVPSLDLAKVQTNLMVIRTYHVTALYEKNPETIQSYITNINKLTDEDNKLLQTYKDAIDGEQEKTLFNNLMNSLTAYRGLRLASLEMLKAQKYDEALADFDNVSKAREIMDGEVQKLIDYNKNNASDQLKKNASTFSTETTLGISLIVLGMILAVGLGMYVARIIGKPLNLLIGAANKMADGDLDVDIEISSKDEVGTLAQAFKRMNDNMNEVISNINSASEQVSSGSKQVSDSSMELSQGATEQASSIEQLTASIEEISSQTKNNAQNAAHAN
ncbi:MAG TPA: methyl-accepting chemotaxis protein, partial [Neobacillus sp.]